MCELEACAQFCCNNVNTFSSRFTKGKLRRGVIGSLSRWGNQVYVFHLSIFWQCCTFSQFFDVCPFNVGYTGGQWFTEWDPDIVKQKYGLACISKKNVPFPPQTAAGSLTLLYKDSLEELRKAAEINRKLVGRLWWRFKISWVAMLRLINIIPRDEDWLCFLSMPWFNPDCQYIRRATREPELTLQHGRRANGDLFEERSFWLSWPRTHLDRWWFYTVLDICDVAFSPVPISTTISTTS